MPYRPHSAAARRDRQLIRIRQLSLWATGVAAAASLGLGTAFAHALPGHAYSAERPAATGGQVRSQPGPSQHPAPAGRASTPAGRASTPAGRSHRDRLTPPHRRPAPSSAPVVTSGGS
jgi:hypothetical protein